MGIEARADLPWDTNLDAEYARLSDLAVSQEATAYQLAVEGMGAYWNAFRQRYPDMTAPAQTMLQRVDYEGIAAVGDMETYFNAQSTFAFQDMYRDWAHDEPASETSITNAFEDLLPLIGELNALPRFADTNALMRRLTYMAFAARAGDSSFVIFPAPPVIQRRTDSGDIREREKYDALIDIDGQFVGAHFPSQERTRTGSPVLAIMSPQIYWHNLRAVGHPLMQELNAMPRRAQPRRILEFVAGILIADAAQLTTPDGDFMEVTTRDAAERNRYLAYRFGLIQPPEADSPPDA